MTNELQTQIYTFGEFRVDPVKRLLLRDAGEIIPLTPKIFDTLLYLVENGGKIIEKDELMQAIWTDTIVEENNLNKNISVLRRVLGEKPGEHRFIVTVPGQGYKFVAEVMQEVNRSEPSAAAADGLTSEFKNRESRIKIENHFDDKSPTEKQSEIEHLKSQIKSRTFDDIQDRKPNRIWLAAIVGATLTGLISLGFYVWQSGEKFAVADAPIKTIAVLPFKPLVAENRDEALEMGMADTLIAKLSRGEKIVVRPLGSVRRYAALEQDSLLAGRELETEAVLDGTIQISGERIRVSAKLLRTNDGKQLWAEKFDEKFTDIFAVQDSISERVAEALKIRLGGAEKKRSTENVEAYQLYMKGRFHHFKLSLTEARKGIEYYNRAIAIDPNYALAYAGIADAYRSFSLTSDVPSGDAMSRAKAAAIKAIEFDETLADAHTALGFINFFYDWDWAAAEKEFRRGLELDPKSADTHQAYAHLLSNTGRHAEALAAIKLAKELDPLNLRTNAFEGQFLLHAGQTDAAIDSLQKTIDLEPNFWMPHLFAASAYTEKGMYEKAFFEGNEAKRLSPSQNWSIAFGGCALAKAGKPVEARTVLNELLELSKTSYVPPYHIALIYNALGQREKSLDNLEKAFADKDVRMVFLKVEPKWNNLRDEPRFIELMRRMNFQ